MKLTNIFHGAVCISCAIFIVAVFINTADANSTKPPPPPKTQTQEQTQVSNPESNSESESDARSNSVSVAGDSNSKTGDSTSDASNANEVLASGTLTGGSTGPSQSIAKSDSSIAPIESFNTTISKEGDTVVHRAGLVEATECGGGSRDLAGGREQSVLGVSWTSRDIECEAIRMANYTIKMFGEHAVAREIMCGTEKFKAADARTIQPLCHDNVLPTLSEHGAGSAGLVAFVEKQTPRYNIYGEKISRK